MAKGCTTGPASTSGPIGRSLNSNEVTTPKLPPPRIAQKPRIAQNRSGFVAVFVCPRGPSAVTMSAERRLSNVRMNYLNQAAIAIARALVLKPEILPLDEVTSALEPELAGRSSTPSAALPPRG